MVDKRLASKQPQTSFNMQVKGLVSCVIPTYKRSDTLKRAVDSLLCQTYQSIEILVVDDNERGSDESNRVAELVDSFQDSKVKLVLQEKHINGAEARNAGVKASVGEFIAFLDDDDEWLPEKIEKQMAILDSDSSIDGVSCLYHELTDGKIFHSCPPYTGEGLHKKVFQREVAVFTSTILLRKKALLEAGLFDTTLRRHQDLQLLLDFTKEHKMAVLNDYYVKLHSDSGINRPSYERLVTIKKDFFRAVAPHLDLYTKREQRQIKAAHLFELAFAALKEKKLFPALGQFIKVGIDIPAYKALYKRMKARKYVALS